MLIRKYLKILLEIITTTTTTMATTAFVKTNDSNN